MSDGSDRGKIALFTSRSERGLDQLAELGELGARKDGSDSVGPGERGVFQNVNVLFAMIAATSCREGRSWRRLEERDCGAVFWFKEIDLIKD